MAKKLGFKDFLNVDYAPGMPDEVKRNAKKRKVDAPTGNTNEELEVDEALDLTQRRKRARQLVKYKSRIKIGRERAKRRVASPAKLKRRSRKNARDMIVKKITKDIPKGELTYARRQEIEKRMETSAMKSKIDRLARKLLPSIRKAELAKHRGKSQK